MKRIMKSCVRMRISKPSSKHQVQRAVIEEVLSAKYTYTEKKYSSEWSRDANGGIVKVICAIHASRERQFLEAND